MNFNPNFEPTMPTLHQVEGAYLELQEHNARHTGVGKAMAGAITLLAAQAESIEAPGFQEAADPSHVDDIGEAEVSKGLLELTADPVFEQIGLTRIGGGTVQEGDRQATSPKQELLIIQSARFVEYLHSARSKFAELPASKEMAETVYNNLLGIIETAGKESGHDPDMARREAIGMLGRLQPVYAELTETDLLDVPIEKGVAYLNWGSRPEFADFLKAQELGLRSGGFSASTWSIDISGDRLIENWDRIFGHYEKVVDEFGLANDLALLMQAEMKAALTATANGVAHSQSSNQVYVESLRAGFREVQQKAMAKGLIGDPNLN